MENDDPIPNQNFTIPPGNEPGSTSSSRPVQTPIEEAYQKLQEEFYNLKLDHESLEKDHIKSQQLLKKYLNVLTKKHEIIQKLDRTNLKEKVKYLSRRNIRFKIFKRNARRNKKTTLKTVMEDNRISTDTKVFISLLLHKR
jgi:hypothetical protein